MSRAGRWIDDRVGDLYDAAVLGADEQRVANGIADDAARSVPRNFFLYVASLVLTKLGDAIASPKTTLTWVMSAAGAPAALIGLLVPLRESGSMLPQIVTAGPIRRLPVRKWVWVAGSLLQAVAVASIGLAALTLEGAAVGWSILGAVALFSLARSLSSVASKDVKGKTIPKTRRGRAGGLAASISGALVLGVGLALLASRREAVPVALYGWLLVGTAGLWLAAAALFAAIRELPGESADDGNGGVRDALARLALLGRDAGFRRFVAARALLMSTALVAPYFVLLGRERGDDRLTSLALFLLAGGLAQTLSSNVWGRLADRSSRRAMRLGGTLAGLLAVATWAVASFVPALAGSRWTFVVAFFVLGIAHAGVRLGRKTYVVDMAEGNRRTDYVAVSNTVIGGLLLLSGALGPLVGLIGPAAMLLPFAAMSLAGVAVAGGLPEVQDG